MIDAYFCDAAEYYENSQDADYHFTRDNGYRFFLIREYAEWLYTINECIRIWEQDRSWENGKINFLSFIKNDLNNISLYD